MSESRFKTRQSQTIRTNQLSYRSRSFYLQIVKNIAINYNIINYKLSPPLRYWTEDTLVATDEISVAD